MRVCSECGIKLSTESNFCPQCGADLKAQKSTAGKTATKGKKATPPDHLSTNKILMILGGLIAVVVIMLFAGGVFDSAPSMPTGNVPQVTNNTVPGASVDLNALQKLNSLRDQYKANPDNHDLLLELAHLLNDSGLFDEAIEKYKIYLGTHPDVPDVMIDMGVCYFEKKDYDSADSIMSAAIKINPKHQIGHLNLGIVNLAKGDMPKSKEWLTKAVALGPETEAGKKAKQLLESH